MKRSVRYLRIIEIREEEEYIRFEDEDADDEQGDISTECRSETQIYKLTKCLLGFLVTIGASLIATVLYAGWPS
jgi:hypothetical protein